MKQTVKQFDQNVTNWVVTTFGAGPRSFFELITMLADPLAIAIVTIVLIGYGAFQHSVKLVMTGAMIPATVIIGSLLKMLFERARPMTEYAMNMELKTFSFPSGHSSASMIAYGILAYIAFMKLPAPWNYVAMTTLMTIPILVGISRIYLGAHFPSDVLAGWTLGLIALCIVVFVIKPLS